MGNAVVAGASIIALFFGFSVIMGLLFWVLLIGCVLGLVAMLFGWRPE